MRAITCHLYLFSNNICWYYRFPVSITIDSTSKNGDMCGGENIKRARSTGGDSPTSVPSKSSCREGLNRYDTSSVSASDLENIPVPLRDATGSDRRVDGAVSAVPRFVGVYCRGMAAASSGRLGRDVALSGSLPSGGFDWEVVEVMEYTCQGEHLNARRFGLCSVETTLNRLSEMTTLKYLRMGRGGCVWKIRESPRLTIFLCKWICRSYKIKMSVGRKWFLEDRYCGISKVGEWFR